MGRDGGCVEMYKENWWEGGFYGLSFLLDLLESLFYFLSLLTLVFYGCGSLEGTYSLCWF